MSRHRRLHLEARDPSRNRLRRWELEITDDLFGVWSVRINFGRIGASGRTLVRLFSDFAAAERYARAAIARRGSAPRRIGVRYRVVEDTDVQSRIPCGSKSTVVTPTSPADRAPVPI